MIHGDDEGMMHDKSKITSEEIRFVETPRRRHESPSFWTNKFLTPRKEEMNWQTPDRRPQNSLWKTPERSRGNTKYFLRPSSSVRTFVSLKDLISDSDSDREIGRVLFQDDSDSDFEC